MRLMIRMPPGVTTEQITLDLAPKVTRKVDLSWRETASKIAIRYAGYVDPGPLRPPFLVIPPEVDANMKRKAERWMKLCDKYRPAYEAKKVAAE